MPIADFVCNDKRCRVKNGAARVYELPIKATHCPMGHKRIVRLFNKVNVNLGARQRERFDGRHTSSRMSDRVDAIAEQPYQEAMAKQDVMKAATAANIKAFRETRTPLIQVVPSARLSSTMAGIFPNNPLAAPAPPGPARKGTDLGGQVADLPPIRAKVEARDTEHKLAKKADGTLEIQRA